MDHQSGESGATRSVAVVIAHGVGEADPGYAATTLAGTLGECGGFRVDEELRVRYLPDVNAPKPDQIFPVFISSGQLASGERITFAELYWADLTKIGPGRIDAVLALFRIIFESHHFIDGMLDRTKGLGVRILRHLLLIASWMLRGPIIGLALNTAVLFWAALYILPKAAERLSEQLLFSAFVAAVFVLSSALLIWAIRRGDATWYDPVSWTAVIAAFLTALFFGLHSLQIAGVSDCPGQPPDCRQNYVDEIYVVLSYLWSTWGAIILLAFIIAASIAYAWHRKGASSEAPPVFTALGVILLQFVLWTAIVGTGVMPLLYRAEEIKGINVLKEKDASLSASVKGTSAERLLNVVPWDPMKSKWIDRVSFAYGFNGFMILCILLIGTITQLRRYRLAKRSTRDPTIDAARMPRILVGSWILAVLLVVTFCQALYLLVSAQIWEGEFFPLVEKVSPALAAHMAYAVSTWKHTVFAIGWVSTLALPMLIGARLGNPVHIARDLIDHQYSRRRASILTMARRARDPTHWPRRARIQARLMTLLDELVQKGRFDHVILAVHSQGSVIALDYLKEAAPGNKELGGLKPDIVTFGSPLKHLYQYYFCEYGDLKGEITTLRNSIGRWINLYRIDDYIGTDIGGGSDLGVADEEIGPGGHTDYWKEDRLGQIILDLATVRPTQEVGEQSR